MSITKSYNKHTDTYYAYDTSYVWNESLQKKVQKKVCIGQYDPITGKIIPNAKRGRPPKNNIGSYVSHTNDNKEKSYIPEQLFSESNNIISEINNIYSDIEILAERVQALKNNLISLQEIALKNKS